MKLPTTAGDLATFLATVYCTLDELYAARCGPRKPARPGAAPEASDSEVLTLAVLAQWQAARSERRFVAYAARHWRAYFPRVLSQSAFNRRARDLAPVLAALGPAVAERVVALWPGAHYEAVDGVPVPLARRCRGLRRRVWAADQAGLGRGGSDRGWYFGVHLAAAVHPCGVVTGFVSAPADTGERWLAEALLRWRHAPLAAQPTAEELAPVLGPSHQRGGQRLGPTGPIQARAAAGPPAGGPYVADLGFRGREWQAHWRAAYRAHVLTKADLRRTSQRTPPPRSGPPCATSPAGTGRWPRPPSAGSPPASASPSPAPAACPACSPASAPRSRRTTSASTSTRSAATRPSPPAPPSTSPNLHQASMGEGSLRRVEVP